MIKSIITGVLIVGFCSVGFSQTEKKVEIKNTTKRKLTFGDIEVENQSAAVYKMLEIRYTLNPLTINKEFVVGGKKYKMFADRKSAITYYNDVKEKAEKKEIYYVTALKSKTTEVFTFRVN